MISSLVWGLRPFLAALFYLKGTESDKNNLFLLGQSVLNNRDESVDSGFAILLCETRIAVLQRL